MMFLMLRRHVSRDCRSAAAVLPGFTPPSGGSVGIGFAIPATTVKPVIEQLKARGYVERGYIGVTVQPVTKEIGDSLGLKESEGALVSGTQPDSPAAKAGIKVGDVITAINGAKLNRAILPGKWRALPPTAEPL